MGTGEEPPARRENSGRRRRWTDGDDDDDEEYVAEEEEEEDFLAEELSASSAGEEGDDSDAEYQEDEDEEEEEETPRPVKGGARGRKGKMDPATARAKRRRYEVDDDYEEELSEDEEVEEYDEETPKPKRPVKGGARGRKGIDPTAGRARQRRYEVDYDYEGEPDNDDEEPDEDEEVEEYHEEIEEEEEAPPRPKSVAKCAGSGQNVDLPRSHRRKYEEDDMDFEPELDADEEEVDEEIEEEEEAPPQPKTADKCDGSGQNVELPRSHRRKYEEDDMDFEPELEEEEEVDEDIDFNPEVDDEDEFEDEEEEEFGASRARKVTVKNPGKRKSVSKRRSLKKKANKGSKASKRKTSSAKSKKSAPVRRVRKRFVVDDSDEDSEDDDDFIVDDQVKVNRHPRKKARTSTSKRKRTELERPSVVEEETWPNVESETSEFEFATSDDEPDDAGTAVVEASTVKKGRKKRKSGSESSSDSEFIVSDKELENLRESEPPKVQPVLPTPIQRNSITRHGEDKGKKKEEPGEAGKPICGICLSEEQRATVQGILNCCSHYFCCACIMEWSRVESRCPLCKQRFTTITKSSKADLGLGIRKAIIKVEERDQVYQPTEEEIRRWLDPYENVVCIECNQGGDDGLMLLCDICDSSAHTYCVGLGREVPDGNWYCGGCRLNDEGPSHARTPRTMGYERQSYRNNVDFISVGFDMAAQNGTIDRSSSLNRRRSFQGIDLNLSPRDVPREIHPAESQVSTDSVSTPSGRRATVSGRRQIHRHIWDLLYRPRSITSTRIDDIFPNLVQLNGPVPRTETNHRSFCSSSEANTSELLPDGIQNHHNGLPFAPSMPLDGDDCQHIEGVKSNLRNMQ